MTIRVNHTFTKTRNPEEFGFKLENQIGTIIHSLDDGYNLILFKQFTTQKRVMIKKRTEWVKCELEWYVHENDLIKL